MHKEILLINSDNTPIAYETLIDFQSKNAYSKTIFWVNQCPRGEYESEQDLRDKATHLLKLATEVSQVFVLKAGSKIETFDHLVQAVIKAANFAETKIAYYIDEEVSSV